MTLADEIFLQARECPTPEERVLYLEQACAHDATLREQVLSLLRSANIADAYFGTEDGLRDYAPPTFPAEELGCRIGRYVLEERLGEGGMGTVYRARQTEPVAREVALKVIKWGMDTRQVVARFEAERQILALMDHPNIAKVLDAGSTETGRPYFVMELVKGRRITDYCDGLRLTLSQRLRLFLTVCQAVQHAHQKGVIHRDLKPSNILVAETDTSRTNGSPRIIDFGVSKAIHGNADIATSQTRSQGSWVGTPAYMSPEQSSGASVGIDTRSDIYSLGIVLYELLTGRTPFEAQTPNVERFDQGPRAQRRGEPPRPSDRLAQMNAVEKADIARARSILGTRAEECLRGDLDCIVMKCLESEPASRYSSANGLARDIERHLANEPVEARPASWPDRMIKTYRRHKAAVTAGVAALIVLLTALALCLRWAVRATQAESAQMQLRIFAEQSAAVARRNLYLAQMSQAHVFWDRREFDRLRQLLVETATSTDRSFEWYYWMRMAHLDTLTYRGHQGSISCLALSPDGTRVATGDGFPSLQVWQVGSGKKQVEIQGIQEPVKSIVFSPDGETLLVGDLGGWIHEADAHTGKELRRWKAHESRVASMTLSPKGDLLVTGGFDGKVKAWNRPGWSEYRRIGTCELPVNTVDVSSDGRWVAAAGYDRTIHLWSLQGDIPGGSLELLPEPDIEYGVAFAPDVRHIAGGDKLGNLRIWTVVDRKMVWSKRAHEDAIHTLLYSKDGRNLFTSGADRVIRVWDSETGRELGALPGHSSGVNALAVGSDRGILISGSSDNTAKVWRFQDDSYSDFRTFSPFQAHGSWVYGLQFLPGSRKILSHINGAWIWDSQTGEELAAFGEGDQLVYEATVSPDGSRILTSSEDRTIRIWATGESRVLRRVETPNDNTRVLRYFPDGRQFLAAGDLGVITIRDAETGDTIRAFPRQDHEVYRGDISPDGLRIVTGGDHGPVRLWRASDGALERELFPHVTAPVSLKFSPDGTRVLAGVPGSGSNLHVADTLTGREVFKKRLNSQGLHRALYSPDGRRILVVNESPTGELLDAETGQEVHSLRGETEVHRAGAFSPDGQRVALGTLGIARDHLIRIWKAAAPEEAAAWLKSDQDWVRNSVPNP